MLLLSSKDLEYPNKNRNEDKVGPVMLNGLLLPLDGWKQHDFVGQAGDWKLKTGSSISYMYLCYKINGHFYISFEISLFFVLF